MNLNRMTLVVAAFAALIIVMVLYAGGGASISARPAQAVLPIAEGETTQPAQPGPGGALIIAVEAAGLQLGHFSNVSGLGSENEVKEKVAGTTVNTEPGTLHWDRIVLTRGLTDQMDVYNWRRLVETGRIAEARMNISIIFYSQELNEVARFDVAGAWPCRYQVDPMTEASVAFTESLHLCHNGFVRVR